MQPQLRKLSAHTAVRNYSRQAALSHVTKRKSSLSQLALLLGCLGVRFCAGLPASSSNRSVSCQNIH